MALRVEAPDNGVIWDLRSSTQSSWMLLTASVASSLAMRWTRTRSPHHVRRGLPPAAASQPRGLVCWHGRCEQTIPTCTKQMQHQQKQTDAFPAALRRRPRARRGSIHSALKFNEGRTARPPPPPSRQTYTLNMAGAWFVGVKYGSFSHRGNVPSAGRQKKKRQSEGSSTNEWSEDSVGDSCTAMLSDFRWWRVWKMIYLTSQLHDGNWELRSVGGGGIIDSSIDRAGAINRSVRSNCRLCICIYWLLYLKYLTKS